MNWRLNWPVIEADEINDMSLSPWGGHRNFAYDLVSYLKPDVVVELGSHLGGSLFAFCQSIKDNQFDTKIYGVDTWQGDEHAGYYGEEVYELVNRIIDQKYRGISISLVRKYFDDAVSEFQDNSIDILHIDGLHTYDAVKNDYETWIPKLKENGIVLFHDVAEDTGYGSAIYWKEISNYHPNLKFEHNWGLGILFPKGDYYYKKLIENNINDKILIYTNNANFLNAQKRGAIDLEWQREQTDYWWQVAEHHKCDLEWQKEQTSYWWERAEKHKESERRLITELVWQKEQTSHWWKNSEKYKESEHQLTIDLEWQKEQTSHWWRSSEKYKELEHKLTIDLEWQKEQTAYWWSKYVEENESHVELARLLEQCKAENNVLIQKIKDLNSLSYYIKYKLGKLSIRGKKNE